MPIDARSIQACCLFAGAAAPGGQAWRARCQERRMRTRPALVETHPPGTAIQLRRDPEYATLSVEGHAPHSGYGWVLAAALAVLALGVAAWFGLFEALHP